MSIEGQLYKSLNLKDKIDAYLKSDKVKSLLSRIFESFDDQMCLTEDNSKFVLYLKRDVLELYTYRTVKLEEYQSAIPIFRSLTRRIYHERRLSHDSVFRLRFSEHGFYKIDQLDESLDADELISTLDELLFIE